MKVGARHRMFNDSSTLDQDKPPIPYRIRQTLTARHYVPPPLLFRNPYFTNYKVTLPEILVRHTHLEFCLTHTSSRGETKYEESRELKITEELKVQDGAGAQVVIVNNSLVAKIFNPLYYSYRSSLNRRVPVDVVEKASREHSLEVASYRELNSALGGTLIPKFHGS